MHNGHNFLALILLHHFSWKYVILPCVKKVLVYLGNKLTNSCIVSIALTTESCTSVQLILELSIDNAVRSSFCTYIRGRISASHHTPLLPLHIHSVSTQSLKWPHSFQHDCLWIFQVCLHWCTSWNFGIHVGIPLVLAALSNHCHSGLPLPQWQHSLC
jgi:hypothetical protein